MESSIIELLSIKKSNNLKIEEISKLLGGKMKKRINTLECENEVLKNTIKDELYKIFMKKLAEPEEIKRYKEDNIRLRKQIKVLKQIIKEERNGN